MINLRHIETKVRFGTFEDTNGTFFLTPLSLSVDETDGNFATCQVSFAPHPSLLQIPMGTPITVYTREFNQFSPGTSLEVDFQVIFFGYLFAHSTSITPTGLAITLVAYTQAYLYDKTWINAEDQGIATLQNRATYAVTPTQAVYQPMSSVSTSTLSGFVPLQIQLITNLSNGSADPFGSIFTTLAEQNLAWQNWDHYYKIGSQIYSLYVNYSDILSSIATQAIVKQRLTSIGYGMDLKSLLGIIMNMVNCEMIDQASPWPSFSGGAPNTTILHYDQTFLVPPPCNYIFPHQILSINYTRNAGAEPTRGWMQADPLSLSTDGAPNAGTMSFLFYAPQYLQSTKDYKVPLLQEELERFIVPIPIPQNMDYADALYFLTNPSYLNGPVAAWVKDTTGTASIARMESAGSTGVNSLPSESDVTTAGSGYDYIEKYVNSVFHKIRYGSRTAQLSITYNPNIMTGMPIVVYLPEVGIYLQGVVDSKSHSLSTGSYTTSLNLSRVRAFILNSTNTTAPNYSANVQPLYAVDMKYINPPPENVMFIGSEFKQVSDYFSASNSYFTTLFPNAPATLTQYGVNFSANPTSNDYCIRNIFDSLYVNQISPENPQSHLYATKQFASRYLFTQSDFDEQYLSTLPSGFKVSTLNVVTDDEKTFTLGTTDANANLQSLITTYQTFLASIQQQVNVNNIPENVNGTNSFA